MSNKLYVLGAGPGDPEEVTPAVTAAISASRTVACAARHRGLAAGHPNIIDMKNFKEMFVHLHEELKKGDAAVIVSGDTGLFSLLPLIKKNFTNTELVVLPGISSLQSLCAKAGEMWQDAVILSGHGREISAERILDATEHNRSVIFFCDAQKNPAWLCSILTDAGLGNVEAVAGERLGASDERITRGAAHTLTNKKFDTLSIVLLINETFTERSRPLPSDTDFIRGGKVPMTHEEVRAVIIAKMHLTPDSVVWDIGAGTGSISIAAAQLCGKVYSVEIDHKAARLVRTNAEKFHLHNIKVCESTALAVIDSLPDPNVIFIGGSGRELPELLKKISLRGTGIRVVASAVALKTIATCIRELTRNGFTDFDAVQVSVSRVKTVGRTQIWQAQNPVAIFTAVTCKSESKGE